MRTHEYAGKHVSLIDSIAGNAVIWRGRGERRRGRERAGFFLSHRGTKAVALLIFPITIAITVITIASDLLWLFHADMCATAPMVSIVHRQSSGERRAVERSRWQGFNYSRAHYAISGRERERQREKEREREREIAWISLSLSPPMGRFLQFLTLFLVYPTPSCHVL